RSSRSPRVSQSPKCAATYPRRLVSRNEWPAWLRPRADPSLLLSCGLLLFGLGPGNVAKHLVQTALFRVQFFDSPMFPRGDIGNRARQISGLPILLIQIGANRDGRFSQDNALSDSRKVI